jgi:hypothetical protein
MFKDGRTNVHDEERSGRRPSVVIDDLVQSVDKKMCEKTRASQFQNFRVNFHKPHAISSTRLSHLGLGYNKFCARWVPKMLTGEHKSENGIGLVFF